MLLYNSVCGNVQDVLSVLEDAGLIRTRFLLAFQFMLEILICNT